MRELCLQRTAKDNSRQYPDASQAVLEKFSLDDYLDSLDEPEKELKRAKELVELLILGRFKLTKFVSSVPHLLDELDNSFKTIDQDEPKVFGSSEDEASSHVLGLKWNHKKDTLVVSRGTKYVDNKNVTQLGNLTVARTLFSGDFDSTELHVFGDSSQKVFSAVAFLRAKVKSGPTTHTQIALILGKARVAPMKCLTVPKLELLAALLATRLKIDIYKALTIPLSTTFIWTDSTTVLQWLRSFDQQPIFVDNRVSEILESTTVDQRFHVPSADNPADAGTRRM